MSKPFIVGKAVRPNPAARPADALPGAALWRSRLLAVCRVNGSGRIHSANERFHVLIGSSGSTVGELRIDKCFSPSPRSPRKAKAEPVRRDLITRAGERIPVVVETVFLPETREELWVFFPAHPESRHVPAREEVIASLHHNVARSVAALARNLHRVSEAAPVWSGENSDLVRSSLALVEQSSLEVRRIGEMLRANSPSAGAKSTERNCA
jgi:hypothetical protein